MAQSGPGEGMARTRRSRMIGLGLALLLLLLALVAVLSLADPSTPAAAWIGKLPQPGDWGLIALALLGLVIGRIGFRRPRPDRDGE